MEPIRNFPFGLRLFPLLLIFAIAPQEDVAALPSEPSAAIAESINTLTLEHALSLTLLKSPELQSFAWEQRAAEAQVLQAGLRPNPVASLSAENAGWDRPAVSDADVTISLGQLIELGGKRGSRIDAARAEGEAVALEYEALKLAVMADVTGRFIAGLGAERLYALQSETAGIAAEIKATVALKVRAGGVSPAEEARAELELQSARLRQQDAEQERNLSRVRLSSLWGEPQPRFAELAGNLDTLAALPSIEVLGQRLDESPEFARLLGEVRARQKRLALARTARTPDLGIEAGVRRLGESDDNAFVGGLSLPLLLFDRNQGNIGVAKADLSRGEAEVARARVVRASELAESYAQISRAQARVETLRREILPTAERVFDEIRTGYERGRFGYVDLLESRRALTEARRDEIESLLRYHLAVTDTELLLGGSLNRTPSEKDPLR